MQKAFQGLFHFILSSYQPLKIGIYLYPHFTDNVIQLVQWADIETSSWTVDPVLLPIVSILLYVLSCPVWTPATRGS